MTQLFLSNRYELLLGEKEVGKKSLCRKVCMFSAHRLTTYVHILINQQRALGNHDPLPPRYDPTGDDDDDPCS